MKQPDLSPKLFKYRVMVGDEIIGQYSNIALATDTACKQRGGGVVLDMSETPPKVVYGEMLGKPRGK